MNVKCTICGAVTTRRGGTGERCPECGARPDFQVLTVEAPRRPSSDESPRHAWEFGPDGPRLVRIR